MTDVQYAGLIYGEVTANNAAVMEDTQLSSDDIEAEINKEMQDLQDSKQEAMFVPVKIDVQCGQSRCVVSGGIDPERGLSSVLQDP